MNKNTYEGKWTEIKGELQKVWGSLTNDELEKAKGNVKSLAGVVRQKLGDTQDNVEDKVNVILKKFNVALEDESPKSDTDKKCC